MINNYFTNCTSQLWYHGISQTFPKVTSYILCDCQQRETFIFRIHNYLSSNSPLTTQLFIWPINILYQLYVRQHYNCSQYRKELIPVQKTAVTCILAIIISISFYTCSFLMVTAMTNTLCGVKKWPIWREHSLPDLNAVPCKTAHDKNPLSNCIKPFLVNYIFLLHQGIHSASRSRFCCTHKPGYPSDSIVKTGAFSNSEICTGSI